MNEKVKRLIPCLLDVFVSTFPIVIIEWIDSKGVINTWEFKDNLDSLLPCSCISVGFLIDDAKTHKTIVQSDSKTQILGRLTIPTKAIVKMKRIKV